MGISHIYLVKVLFVSLVVFLIYFYIYELLVRQNTNVEHVDVQDNVADGIHSGRYDYRVVDHLSRNHMFDADDLDWEKSYSENAIDVSMIFTKADGNLALKEKFALCLSSLLQYSSRPIHLHLISDEQSLTIARKIVDQEARSHPSTPIKVFDYDADVVGARTDLLVGDVKKYFMYKPGAYYSDSLFFFSIIMHKVFIRERVILLDVDLKFKADIADLQRYFDSFLAENVIGIAKEQQPVYRHIFHMYRKEHPDSPIGEPPPDGLPGFNSAVVLLDLQRMRNSPQYGNLLNETYISDLVTKYKFQGHLGDQDFFTLVSLENMNLFYILPCGWNRQLCQWWKAHGYEDVFEQYHRCDDDVKIVHGNCNTPIPEE